MLLLFNAKTRPPPRQRKSKKNKKSPPSCAGGHNSCPFGLLTKRGPAQPIIRGHAFGSYLRGCLKSSSGFARLQSPMALSACIDDKDQYRLLRPSCPGPFRSGSGRRSTSETPSKSAEEKPSQSGPALCLERIQFFSYWTLFGVPTDQMTSVPSLSKYSSRLNKNTRPSTVSS